MDFELRQVIGDNGVFFKLQMRVKEFLGPGVDDPYSSVYSWSEWTDVPAVTTMDVTIEEIKRIRDEG